MMAILLMKSKIYCLINLDETSAIDHKLNLIPVRNFIQEKQVEIYTFSSDRIAHLIHAWSAAPSFQYATRLWYPDVTWLNG